MRGSKWLRVVQGWSIVLIKIAVNAIKLYSSDFLGQPKCRFMVLLMARRLFGVGLDNASCKSAKIGIRE
jgi:hypothetical protein